MKWVAQAFDHSVPGILHRWKGGIHWVHLLQRLLYQRNGLIKRKVKSVLKRIAGESSATVLDGDTVIGTILDVGCGDGHYIFVAKSAPFGRLLGIDRNGAWINFLGNYFGHRPEKSAGITEFVCADLDDGMKDLGDETVDLIFCFAVLPYVKNASFTLSEMHRVLRSGKSMLLYVPVGFKIETRLYRWMFHHFNHYESQQGRQAVFESSELLNMLGEAGFEVSDRTFAYGKLGRWGHEIWSMTTMLLGSGRWPLVTLGVVVAPISLVLLLILKGLDQSSTLTDGNGMYCECRKR
jgi:SAM-dependent methyltransferase